MTTSPVQQAAQADEGAGADFGREVPRVETDEPETSCVPCTASCAPCGTRAVPETPETEEASAPEPPDPST